MTEESSSGRLVASESLLLTAAAIWGFAFVAQRVAMEAVGPFTFNAIRFALGSLPMLALLSRRRPRPTTTRQLVAGGVLTGIALFGGATLQQVGLVYTTAGKAGFITGLYVVFTPILGLFIGRRPGPRVWIGAVLAVIGLFLLSMTERFVLAPGDALVLGGAAFWAWHVLLVAALARPLGVARLAVIQFWTCSALSLAVALVFEEITLAGLRQALIPILYGGFLSVGVAYVLQLVGQKRTPPTPAAIILSLEAVFAAIGGWWLLGEVLPGRSLVGCALMLSGAVMAQLARATVRFGVPRGAA